MAPSPKDQYPPEIIVLLSSKISNDTSSKFNFLYPIFCNRIIRVEHIPIGNDVQTLGGNNNCDNNCGWTKLRAFELESYDSILYISADCLVVKDISHLLRIDDSTTSHTTTNSNSAAKKRVGLLAAAPDIFQASDRFNAGVMVLRPSKTLFEQMMSRLPTLSVSNSKEGCASPVNGEDTGFLNSFYPEWCCDMPAYSRLSVGYNAQPKYWNEGIEDLSIIHFSSSPKPWERNIEDETKESLSNKDASSLQFAHSGKFDCMWHDAFKRSQQYYAEELKQQSLLKRRRTHGHTKSSPSTASGSVRSTPHPTASPPVRMKQQNPHSLAQRRYRELRKAGMDMKEAMFASRKEFGLDEADGNDAGKAVGQMFGLA